MEITSGKIQSAQKVVVYGPEGIGKSTFASKFPDPVFADTEGSTKHMDVKRLPKPASWTMLFEEIKYIRQNPGLCKTFVIDTIDWAEKLCISHICANAKKKSIEDFGYGSGYVCELEEMGNLLRALDELIDAGINVVLTAHAQLRKFEQPDEMGAYDRWELKLGKKTGSQISPIIKEWADMVLFINYKTFSVAANDKGTKHKAQGGARTMYTTHHPCWDAKNRHGLDDGLPFDYTQIAHCIENTPETPIKTERSDPVIPKPQPDLFEVPDASVTLDALMKQNNVTAAEIQQAVAYKGYYPEDTPIENYASDFINGVLVGAWDQVFTIIQKMRKEDVFQGGNQS